MRIYAVTLIVLLLFSSLLLASCRKAQSISLWKRHCEACHDGKTLINGKVLLDKNQMVEKYKTLPEFINSCGGTASCMNILKHDKKLFEAAGKEIGIGTNR
jgi:hypothetical protein